MQHSLKYLLMSATVALLTCYQVMAQAGWVPFSPPGKGFTVMMPTAQVEPKTEEREGQKFTIYSAKDSQGTAYVVEDGVPQDPKSQEFRDGFFKGGIGAVNKAFEKVAGGPVENVITEVSGEGWSGKKATLNRNGNTIATVLIAYSNNKDLAYSLIVTAPDTNANAKTFLESFKVDPDVASKAHAGENPYTVLTHEVGQWAGWAGLIVGGILAVIIGIVVLVVTTKKK